MTWHRLFLCGRLIASAVFLVTWGYGVTTYSPFAFDMFVTPRLFSELTTFVVWHHAFYWLAYLASAATLIPDLRGPRRGARLAAIGYIVVFGAVGVYLLGTPFLAMLNAQSRSVAVVPGALLPLVWLSVIDHLAVGLPEARVAGAANTGQRTLLVASLATAVLLWAVHVATTYFGGRTMFDGTGWAATALIALIVDVAALMIVFAVLGLVSAFAATRRNPFATELYLAAGAGGVAVGELWRRAVLPSFGFDTADAALIASGLALTTAMVWSGLRVRRPAVAGAGGIVHLTSISGASAPAAAITILVAIAGAASAIARIEQMDWAYVLHSLIAVAEAAVVFGAFVGVWSVGDARRWSPMLTIAPPTIAAAALFAAPHAADALARRIGDARLEARVLVDRLAPVDPLANVAAQRLIDQPSFDTSYFRGVVAAEARQSTLDPAVPKNTFVGNVVPPPATPPHVFMMVVDSLRRDYLSAYNPQVTFTPSIGAWARDSYAFRNAFTPYGGTWLSMPSIWTGSQVTRGWGRIFPDINGLEPLIVGAKFDWVINDFTVATLLKPNPHRTFLDPEIPSVQTDMCRNLQSLQERLSNRDPAAPPLFAYLSPMNVHIINTHANSREGQGTYPGFYAPYATRLERIDKCFGLFVDFLKAHNLYDNSIIVLTSDHGDDLGDEGRWGHQFYVFPEAIRVPLIVHLPKRFRATVTTDLSRIAFPYDLLPTFLTLFGQPERRPGALFGAPLFVDPDSEPQPRRRDNFLVMSSYGSTYGMLRRNGRFLYISDLLNWREYAYTLFEEPNGRRVPVDGATRTVNQRLIREHLDRVDNLYRRQ